jgi:hypothetical protein
MEWSKLKLSTDDTNSLYVTNANVQLPSGVEYYPDFFDNEFQRCLLDDIDQNNFHWEGFDQRRRVQTFTRSDTEQLPLRLLQLVDKVEKRLGRQVSHVAIEVYSPEKWSQTREYASNFITTTFENGTCSSCSTHGCNCFVAQMPLLGTAIQHWNRPKKRHPNCWTLMSADHYTDVRMDPGSLLVRSGDCLVNWRRRIAASPTLACSKGVTILKFYNLSNETSGLDYEVSLDDNFGYIPRLNDCVNAVPMPPIETLLTIVVTTSPVKSNPSTELLEKSMATFEFAGPVFAHACRKVIVCGMYKTVLAFAVTSIVSLALTHMSGLTHSHRRFSNQGQRR